jgi:hypothetical protein
VTDPIGVMMVHTASVQTYLGQGKTSSDFASPVTVACYDEDEVHQTTASTGEIVASKHRLFVRLADGAKFPPKSLVTVNGYTGPVISQSRRTAGPVFTILEHCEVHLA